MVVEDLSYRIELQHRLDRGNIHAPDVECGDFESARPGVEVDRKVGIRAQESVEQEPGVSAGRGCAVWGPMAFAIMGGLLVATLLTLVFLPVLYVT